MLAELSLATVKDGSVYTVKEVSLVLRVSYNTLRAAINSGELEASRPGGYRVTGAAIREYWRRKQVKPSVAHPEKASSRQAKGQPVIYLDGERLRDSWSRQE